MLNSALTDHIEEYKLHVLQEEGDEEDSESEGEGGAGSRAQITPADPAPVRVRAPAGRSGRINLFDPTVAPRRRSPPQSRLSDVCPAPSLANIQDSGNRFAHLKKLQGPEVTQAPFKIPPLFPYERSVVYLLVPPTTKQLKYAKSVTLSATTIAGGKLSLSIPITHIKQPGETVHQLAARMLLRDLEEGRSWLHSDKCGVPGGDPARVQEYVQREGEEVGMRWSLASKWTSFIGVEEEIMDVAPIRAPASPEGDLSALPEGRYSAPFTPSISAETSADSEDIMTASTSTSSSRFDGIPLLRSRPTHSVPVAIGSESLPRVLRGALVVNSGVDTMSRLLAPRDTPDPTHPIWAPPIPPPHGSPQPPRPARLRLDNEGSSNNKGCIISEGYGECSKNDASSNNIGDFSNNIGDFSNNIGDFSYNIGDFSNNEGCITSEGYGVYSRGGASGSSIGGFGGNEGQRLRDRLQAGARPNIHRIPNQHL
ncbi:unnamed protein product [Tuber aestivum]|uniref:Uncharacterized protein n=1 Tax=Tuber aestivum TaxID=59557 RepID=A0A292PMA1_9PEZI|nr:unnamed protein product [Tuber aestivum]